MKLVRFKIHKHTCTHTMVRLLEDQLWVIPFMPFPKAQSPSSSIIWRGEPGNRPLKNRFRGNIVGGSFIYIFRIRSGFLPTLSSYTTRPVSDPIAQAALPSSLPARKAHKRKE